MSGRKFTPQQQAAIDDRGGTLLISAAAGAGKTSVLTERVSAIISDEEHPVSPENLLVVTFTNAAAAEMKQRIYHAMAKRIAADPESAFLRRQQALVPRSDICTIHAFCLKLIREHFSALGLRRDFSLADEAQVKLLKHQAVAQVLEEQYAVGDVVFLELADLINQAKNDLRLEETVRELADFLVSHPYPRNFVRRAKELYDNTDIVASPWGGILCDYAAEQAGHYIERIESVAGEAARQDSALREQLEKFIISDTAALNLIYTAANAGEFSQLQACMQTFSLDTFRVGKDYTNHPVKLRYHELRKNLSKDMKAMRERQFCRTPAQHAEDVAALRPLVSRLFDLVLAYMDRLDEIKRRENVLEFSDLEQLALALLTTTDGEEIYQSELAKTLTGSIHCIMVDEYQDTNEAQDALFYALSASGDNLFFVGDVKQSVYRFRQASPALFIKKLHDFLPYDKTHYPATLFLGTNFRSSRGVTDFVNFLFARVMSERVGEIAYDDNQMLQNGGGYDGSGVDCKTEFYLVNTEKKAPPEDEQLAMGQEAEPEDTRTNIEKEADFVADKIRSMVDGGFLVRDGDSERPARYGDFAVLLRSTKTAAPVFLACLKRAGIPTAGENGQGFLAQKEIAMVLNLLRCLQNPKQDTALVGLMLSPLFHFSPTEIAKIKASTEERGSFYARVLACRSWPKVSAFLDSLHHYRQLALVLPARELLERIYRTTDLYNLVAGLRNPAPRRENLRLLLHYAQGFASSGSVQDFLRYLERIEGIGEDLPGAQNPGGQNCVQVMSIHKSKGLEFPVCFVSRLGGKYNKQDIRSKTLISSKLGFACWRRRENYMQHPTLMYEATKLQLEAETISEEMRILYVALTRAKQKLVMTAVSDKVPSYLRARFYAGTSAGAVKASDCFADFIISALAQHPGADGLVENIGVVPAMQGDFGEIVTVVVSPPQIGESERQEDMGQVDEGLLGQLREKVAYSYPHAPVADIPAKVSVSVLAKGRKTRLNTRPVFSYQGGLTPTERGNAVHKFMQYCDYHRAAADPAGEVERLLQNQFVTAPEAEAVEAGQIEAFFRSEIGQEILNSRSLHRELRFFVKIGPGEIDPDTAGFDEEILVQGVADCVIERPDSLVIVDYKTDRVKDAEQLLERYAKQLEIYTRGIGEMLGKPVARQVLYSFYLNQYIDIVPQGETKTVRV